MALPLPDHFRQYGVDFSTIDFLKGVHLGAFDVLKSLQIMEALSAVPFPSPHPSSASSFVETISLCPLLAGTFPLGLQKAGSDLDIVASCPSPTAYRAIVRRVVRCLEDALAKQEAKSVSVAVMGYEALPAESGVGVCVIDGAWISHHCVANGGAGSVDAEGRHVVQCSLDDVRGIPSLSVDFTFKGRQWSGANIAGDNRTDRDAEEEDYFIGIFVQPVPSHQQNGFRHLLIEHRLMVLGGEVFVQKVKALRRDRCEANAADATKRGLKTEPAFVCALGGQMAFEALLSKKSSFVSLLESPSPTERLFSVELDPYKALLLMENYDDQAIVENFFSSM